MTAAYTFFIVERKSILAVILMTIDMLLWDEEMNDVNDVGKIREVRLEPCLEVDVVLACHVIGFNNP
jgi:hypothetical protein